MCTHTIVLNWVRIRVLYCGDNIPFIKKIQLVGCLPVCCVWCACLHDWSLALTFVVGAQAQLVHKLDAAYLIGVRTYKLQCLFGSGLGSVRVLGFRNLP